MNDIRSNLALPKRDGIQIHLSRIDNQRAITQLLDESIYEYYMFKLQEEKTLTVVLRGFPQILSTDEIKNNLMEVGVEVISIARIHKKIEGLT